MIPLIVLASLVVLALALIVVGIAKSGKAAHIRNMQMQARAKHEAEIAGRHP